MVVRSRIPSFSEAAPVRFHSLVDSSRNFKAFVDEEGRKKLAESVDAIRKQGGSLSFSLPRLNELGGQAMKPLAYTHYHCAQVGFLADVAVSVFLVLGMLPKELVKFPREIALTAGNLHDNGKVFIPYPLLTKELGYMFMRVVRGANQPLTNAELSALRQSHLDLGVDFLKKLDFDHKDTIVSMVACHHVTYDGLTAGKYASYPEGKIGRELESYKTILKVCDVISACLPRFYRPQNHIQNLEDAMALAVAVSGTQLDPVVVAALFSGIYGMSYHESSRMVQECVYIAKEKLSKLEETPDDWIAFSINHVVKPHHLFSKYVTRTRRNLFLEHIYSDLYGNTGGELECLSKCAVAFRPEKILFP
ncbi:MAG: HD domain-containing protein [Candidatus Micrarchaeota archaeon]|nr:HD domain-containing protein [Candidatus Micrarchaeota archaeon]